MTRTASFLATPVSTTAAVSLLISARNFSGLRPSASVTSISFLDGRIASVAYREPAAELYLAAAPTRKFVAGA